MTTDRIQEQFVQAVEAFLRSSKMAPAAFGREALHDPTFVAKLRKGRSPSLDVADRVLAYIRRERTKNATVRL